MGYVGGLEMNLQLLVDIHNVKVAANASGDADVITAANALPTGGGAQLNSGCS